MSLYRKLLPTESVRYRDHLLRLSADDRHARFCGLGSDETIMRYCRAIDWRFTTLIGFFADGVLRGAGELRSDPRFWPDHGKIAFSVEPGFQGRGIGGILQHRILTVARNRSIRAVTLICLAGNLRMRRLALRHADKITIDEGEATAVLHLPWPTQATLAEEMIDDGAGAVGTILHHFAHPERKLAAA